MGGQIDRSSWPKPGSHRDLLVLLDRVYQENGSRSLRAIAESMHLSAPSRVSAILRGLARPAGDDQVRALVEALGGSSEDADEGVAHYRKISDSPGDRSAKRSKAVPKVGESADLTSRLWPAAFPIDYVTRDVEKDISTLLLARRPVVLVGSSMVGKTRIAASVIEAEFSGRRLYSPGSWEELRALAESPPRDAVVFLDDIERLLGASGVTQRGIRSLSERNALVATIHSRPYNGYQRPATGRRAPEWDALGEFEPVVVFSALSSVEQARLAAVVQDETTLRRILETGIGEHVGAAEEIKLTLKVAPTLQPIGMALLFGAADWARAGLRRPAPEGLLAELAAPYLTRRQAGMLRRAGLDEALEWATKEINPHVSLLEPADDGFEINVYALEVLSATATPIPEPSWRLLLDAATPEDLISISGCAGREGRPDIAESALLRCEEANDPATWPVAAMLHGAGLRERGDTAAAQAAYHRAIDSGHPIAAPGAWFNLGNLHAGEGRLEDAQEAYRNAADSGHPAMAPRSLLALGRVLERSDLPAEAEGAYRRVIAWDPDLETLQQDTERSLRERDANIVLRTVDLRRHRPDPEVTGRALLDLAQLLIARGERDEARQLLERAARLKAGALTADALHTLGGLLAEDDEVSAAVDSYERALALADQESAPKTEANLGAALLHLREYDRAEVVLRSAMRSWHEEARVVAGMYLVLLLVRLDRRDEAEAVLSELVDLADNAAGRSAVGKMLLLEGGPGVSPALPHMARTILHVLEGDTGTLALRETKDP